MFHQATSFGRNKDKSIDQQLKGFGIEEGQDNERVKLQYLDKQGRKLTLKEAFREMCWKFHGKKPSHRKLEKRSKKAELEDK